MCVCVHVLTVLTERAGRHGGQRSLYLSSELLRDKTQTRSVCVSTFRCVFVFVLSLYPCIRNNFAPLGLFCYSGLL